ncbi:uncharacterized protein [Dendropsophus ebraccatus]|uniref:uncharacterized protein n=1 Tax=Dendropsophus ebraccatus TaxID=150705 RepID=UPI00383216FC
MGTCQTTINYCVYQPRSVHVRIGDPVTIPCSYTYPDRYRGESQIIITWGEIDGSDCLYMKNYITDAAGNILDEYKERKSTVTHPDNRTASLIIRGWKPSDGTIFCCRIYVIPSQSEKYSWYDPYGTSLTFEDGRLVYQVEELMAVPGEELIIPCHYPLKTLGEAQQVAWYTGDRELCVYKNNEIYTRNTTPQGGVYRYSLVNFPEDVSLRIHTVQGDEFHHFCCNVTTKNGTIQSRYGTELIITDSSSSSPFNITQPHTITGHRGESATLSCSYTSYMESDVLGTTIYWRLGNLSGPYVYHPYKEMVYPGYRGRTEITGAADLHIQGLNMSDDAMYYCFVMVRLCTGSNKYKKLIHYGGGTRLIVTGLSIGFAMIVSISAAILLVLLCVLLVFLKTTEKRPCCGISTKNTEHSLGAESEGGAKEKRMEREKEDEENKTQHDKGAESKGGAKEERKESEKDEEENENVLYSELNKTKLLLRTPAPYQEQKEETVYVAVISPELRK